MTISPDPPPRPEADLLSAAVEYADQGIAIMPCRGKRPALSRTGEAHAVATSDADQVRQWWQRTDPNYNIGIVCTANRLAVIDIDGPAGVEWIREHRLPMPTTWTAITGRGHHYYYRWPEGETIRTCQIAPKLEIRAAGAYVVAPPSIHPDGDTYRWAHSTRCDWDDIPELPPEWITLQAQKSSTSTEPLSTIGNTAPPTLQPQKSSTIPTGNTIARKRLAGLAHHLATTAKGGRHQALYTISRKLGGLVASGHLTSEQIEARLRAAADSNGLLAEDRDHNITQTIADGITKGIDDGPDPEHHEPSERIPYTLTPGEGGGLAEPDGYVLLTAADIRPEKVEWYYPGRVPLGSLTLLVGPPGLGKTTFACELGARGTRGQLVEGAAADVIFISAEDSLANTLVPRFNAAGADLARVHFMKIREADGLEGGLSLPDDIAKLQHAVETTGANLVVLDPVVAHLSGNIDSHKDLSVRRALAPLAALAESTGAAVLGIGHLNKSPGTDVVTRVGGSVAFTAAARSVLLLDSDPTAAEDSPERLLIHGKTNLGPPAVAVRLRVETRTITFEGEEIETSGIAWLGEDPTATAAKVLGGRQEPKKLEIATNFLREVLAEGGRPRAEVEALAEDEDIKLSTLKRAARALGIGSQREGFGTGSSWTLPRPTLPIQSTIQPMTQKYGLNERESSRKPLQDNTSSIQSIGPQNDGLNGGDGLNGEPPFFPHSVHPETPEPNDGLNGGSGSRKPLQDNGSSIQSIGSELSEHLSDEPNGVESPADVLLDAFHGAEDRPDLIDEFRDGGDLPDDPNAHLPYLAAPSEPLGVDAEPEPSEQTSSLPWD